MREPIRIFIDSIPPPPPEICDEIIVGEEAEEDEIKDPEALQEMRNKTLEDQRRHSRPCRPWARKVISAPGGRGGKGILVMTNAVMGIPNESARQLADTFCLFSTPTGMRGEREG